MLHFEIKICCVFWIICWVSFYFWIDFLEGHAMEIVIFWIGNWSRVNIVAFSGRLLWGFIFCVIEIVGIMVDGVLLCCFVGTTCSVGYGIDWAWTSSCYNCFFFSLFVIQLGWSGVASGGWSLVKWACSCCLSFSGTDLLLIHTFRDPLFCLLFLGIRVLLPGRFLYLEC